jgi:hypothetical protein
MHLGLNGLASSAAVAVGVLILASPTPMAGQTAGTAAVATPDQTLPRLPNGRPDLQGYWTNATFTPLERPAELGMKEFFTEEEAAAYEAQRRLRENSQPKDDLHYDNVIWQGDNPGKNVSNGRTSLIFDPPDGRIPPLTENGRKLAAERREAARRREAAESVQSRNLAERCITWGNDGPPMLGSTYNANLQIVQTDQALVISHEMIHAMRIVPLDGRPHLAPGIRQRGGDSRGRWEGDTLVVDSTNFTDETNFRGAPANARQDIFSSRDLRVVERFTAIDANTIAYRFTVEDPSVWTRPWSGELFFRRNEGPILEYTCHEGNYGLTNILAGARAAEQAAAEATKKDSK